MRLCNVPMLLEPCVEGGSSHQGTGLYQHPSVEGMVRVEVVSREKGAVLMSGLCWRSVFGTSRFQNPTWLKIHVLARVPTTMPKPCETCRLIFVYLSEIVGSDL